VQPDGVEPRDVLDDGELELRAGAPHTIGDQLGLNPDLAVVVGW